MQTTSTDNWDACIRAVGINEKLRTSLLLPEIYDIRFTATCKYWVLDAMEICYGTLKDLNRRLIMERARTKQLQKAEIVGARLKRLQKAPKVQKAAGSISE